MSPPQMRKTQPLSQCQALCANKEANDDFLENVWAAEYHLKTDAIYNVDDTGMSSC